MSEVVMLLLALAAAPDARAVDYARALSMPGNFTHCTRFRNLQCKPDGRVAGRFACTYSEYASRGPWPLKRILLDPTSDPKSAGWKKVGGDTPACVVMFLDEPKVEGSNDGNRR